MIVVRDIRLRVTGGSLVRASRHQNRIVVRSDKLPLAHLLPTCDPLIDFGIRRLLQEFRLKASVDFVLMARVAVCLERCNQATQSRSKDDQITRASPRGVGVGNTGGYEHCFTRIHLLRSIAVSKRQFPF